MSSTGKNRFLSKRATGEFFISTPVFCEDGHALILLSNMTVMKNIAWGMIKNAQAVQNTDYMKSLIKTVHIKTNLR